MFDFPLAVFAATVKVSVLEPVVLVGLNDAVTPLGNPEAERATEPLNPFTGTTEILVVPELPAATVKLAGDADIEKSIRLYVALATLLDFAPIAIALTTVVSALKAIGPVYAFEAELGVVPSSV
jgi:hypothetical protein